MPAPTDATLPMVHANGDAPLLPMEDVAKPKKKKDKESKTDLSGLGTKRGVETMFRTSYRVNMDLSSLADAKANIMISINGLIVSILIASIAPKVDANPWLLVPTSIFLLGCVVSLVFAVLAARPRIQSNLVTLEQAREGRTNMLFFGNFAHIQQNEFVLVMKELMQDPDNLYEMMITDIYGVGSVLQKKYRMLRTSYSAFMVALVVGVLSFIAVFSYAAFFESGPSVIVTTPAPTSAPALPGILP